MRTLEFTFNRPLACVVLATLVLLIVLTGMMNAAPLRGAFAGDPSINVVMQR
jgi:hypothetical protein